MGSVLLIIISGLVVPMVNAARWSPPSDDSVPASRFQKPSWARSPSHLDPEIQSRADVISSLEAFSSEDGADTSGREHSSSSTTEEQVSNTSLSPVSEDSYAGGEKLFVSGLVSAGNDDRDNRRVFAHKAPNHRWINATAGSDEGEAIVLEPQLFAPSSPRPTLEPWSKLSRTTLSSASRTTEASTTPSRSTYQTFVPRWTWSSQLATATTPAVTSPTKSPIRSTPFLSVQASTQKSFNKWTAGPWSRTEPPMRSTPAPAATQSATREPFSRRTVAPWSRPAPAVTPAPLPGSPSTNPPETPAASATTKAWWVTQTPQPSVSNPGWSSDMVCFQLPNEAAAQRWINATLGITNASVSEIVSLQPVTKRRSWKSNNPFISRPISSAASSDGLTEIATVPQNELPEMPPSVPWQSSLSKGPVAGWTQQAGSASSENGPFTICTTRKEWDSKWINIMKDLGGVTQRPTPAAWTWALRPHVTRAPPVPVTVAPFATPSPRTPVTWTPAPPSKWWTPASRATTQIAQSLESTTESFIVPKELLTTTTEPTRRTWAPRPYVTRPAPVDITVKPARPGPWTWVPRPYVTRPAPAPVTAAPYVTPSPQAPAPWTATAPSKWRTPASRVTTPTRVPPASTTELSIVSTDFSEPTPTPARRTWAPRPYATRPDPGEVTVAPARPGPWTWAPRPYVTPRAPAPVTAAPYVTPSPQTPGAWTAPSKWWTPASRATVQITKSLVSTTESPDFSTVSPVVPTVFPKVTIAPARWTWAPRPYVTRPAPVDDTVTPARPGPWTWAPRPYVTQPTPAPSDITQSPHPQWTIASRPPVWWTPAPRNPSLSSSTVAPFPTSAPPAVRTQKPSVFTWAPQMTPAPPSVATRVWTNAPHVTGEPWVTPTVRPSEVPDPRILCYPYPGDSTDPHWINATFGGVQDNLFIVQGPPEQNWHTKKPWTAASYLVATGRPNVGQEGSPFGQAQSAISAARIIPASRAHWTNAVQPSDNHGASAQMTFNSNWVDATFRNLGNSGNAAPSLAGATLSSAEASWICQSTPAQRPATAWTVPTTTFKTPWTARPGLVYVTPAPPTSAPFTWSPWTPAVTPAPQTNITPRFVLPQVTSAPFPQRTAAPAIVNPATINPSALNGAMHAVNLFLYGIQTGAQYAEIQQINVQVPEVWEALDNLRGKTWISMTSEVIQGLIQYAVPGKDYPTINEIPETKTFACEKVNQPGFYADADYGCQVIRRCDINAMLWSYLCPSGTLFNQITLVCDWYFNVDCGRARQFYDYSNPRLYHSNWVLLDDAQASSLIRPNTPVSTLFQQGVSSLLDAPVKGPVGGGFSSGGSANQKPPGSSVPGQNAAANTRAIPAAAAQTSSSAQQAIGGLNTVPAGTVNSAQRLQSTAQFQNAGNSQSAGSQSSNSGSQQPPVANSPTANGSSSSQPAKSDSTSVHAGTPNAADFVRKSVSDGQSASSQSSNSGSQQSGASNSTTAIPDKSSATQQSGVDAVQGGATTSTNSAQVNVQPAESQFPQQSAGDNSTTSGLRQPDSTLPVASSGSASNESSAARGEAPLKPVTSETKAASGQTSPVADVVISATPTNAAAAKDSAATSTVSAANTNPAPAVALIKELPIIGTASGLPGSAAISKTESLPAAAQASNSPTGTAQNAATTKTG